MKMATKKSQPRAQAKPAAMPQASAGMDSRSMLRWVYVGGGLVAALAGAFTFQNQILSWVLMLAGVIVGWFYVDTEDVTNTGIRYLLLYVVFNALETVPLVGVFITGFVSGFLAFLGPKMLVMLIHWIRTRVASRLM
jgi:hypothetical protein